MPSKVRIFVKTPGNRQWFCGRNARLMVQRYIDNLFGVRDRISYMEKRVKPQWKEFLRGVNAVNKATGTQTLEGKVYRETRSRKGESIVKQYMLSKKTTKTAEEIEPLRRTLFRDVRIHF